MSSTVGNSRSNSRRDWPRLRSRCSSKDSPCSWLVSVALHGLRGRRNEAKQPTKVEPAAARSARVTTVQEEDALEKACNDKRGLETGRTQKKKKEREKRSTKQTSTGRGGAEIAVVREESGETC